MMHARLILFAACAAAAVPERCKPSLTGLAVRAANTSSPAAREKTRHVLSLARRAVRRPGKHVEDEPIDGP